MEEIRQQEQGGDYASVLDGVRPQCPALLRAQRLQEKAAGVGLEFPDRDEGWGKVQEELEEFREAVAADEGPERQHEELGDLLFALVNYARYADLNPENALRDGVDSFTDRFQQVERRLAGRGVSINEADLAEMRRLWAETNGEEESGRSTDA